MFIEKVTITGADDGTAIPDLLSLSEEFPFVEWGILVSKAREGGYRFPSRKWIDRLATVAMSTNLNLSMHVCGRWVREMFVGELDWQDLPPGVDQFQRLQINTHQEIHPSTTGLISSLFTKREKQFIFQWDGVNNHLTYACKAYGLNIAALYDTSGGAGVLPKNWPNPVTEFPCGFAGGLGPENVIDQLKAINNACPRDYTTWIDMERRVRVEDDSALDMDKVRGLLELTKGYRDGLVYNTAAPRKLRFTK